MKNFAEEDCISLICTGEFDALPGYTIGELFESFFDNINYNVINEDEIYVDFTGDATCDDEPCSILIRFKVDENLEDFAIDEVKVDGETLEEDEIIDLLEDIAYASGAIIEDECSLDDCEHCHDEHHHCHSEECDCEDEEEYDDYDEEDDYDDNYEDDDNDEDDDN